MGERQVDQGRFVLRVLVEKHVPVDHMLRSIDRFVDLCDVRTHLAPFYSTTGRPSVDPELLIRMLIIGYCYGIRSERRLCEEVHLNLAYRWFCRLGLAGEVPDHFDLSKNRHGRFRAAISCAMSSRRCCAAASKESRRRRRLCSRRQPDQGRCQPPEGRRRHPGLASEVSSRAVDEYLAVLDDAAFGAATEVTPNFISPADPAARWTAPWRPGVLRLLRQLPRRPRPWHRR